MRRVPVADSCRDEAVSLHMVCRAMRGSSAMVHGILLIKDTSSACKESQSVAVRFATI